MASKTFAKNVSEFVKKTNLSLNVVLRKLALDCLKQVILMSPVDTGRFRGNWRVAINRTDLTVDPTLFDTTGAKTLAAGTAIIQQAKFGDAIIVSNNVHYAPYLEQGHSKQAPNGVLFPSFELVKAQFLEVLKAV